MQHAQQEAYERGTPVVRSARHAAARPGALGLAPPQGRAVGKGLVPAARRTALRSPHADNSGPSPHLLQGADGLKDDGAVAGANVKGDVHACVYEMTRCSGLVSVCASVQHQAMSAEWVAALMHAGAGAMCCNAAGVIDQC